MDEFYEEEYKRDLREQERGNLEEDPYKLQAIRNKAKKTSSWLLTVVQISVCAALIIAALVLKAFGGEWYNTARDWYIKNASNSIVAEEQIDQVKTRVLELIPPASSPPEESSSEASGSESSSQ